MGTAPPTGHLHLHTRRLSPGPSAVSETTFSSSACRDSHVICSMARKRKPDETPSPSSDAQFSRMLTVAVSSLVCPSILHLSNGTAILQVSGRAKHVESSCFLSVPPSLMPKPSIRLRGTPRPGAPLTMVTAPTSVPATAP